MAGNEDHLYVVPATNLVSLPEPSVLLPHSFTTTLLYRPRADFREAPPPVSLRALSTTTTSFLATNDYETRSFSRQTNVHWLLNCSIGSRWDLQHSNYIYSRVISISILLSIHDFSQRPQFGSQLSEIKSRDPWLRRSKSFDGFDLPTNGVLMNF